MTGSEQSNFSCLFNNKINETNDTNGNGNFNLAPNNCTMVCPNRINFHEFCGF